MNVFAFEIHVLKGKAFYMRLRARPFQFMVAVNICYKCVAEQGVASHWLKYMLPFQDQQLERQIRASDRQKALNKYRPGQLTPEQKNYVSRITSQRRQTPGP